MAPFFTETVYEPVHTTVWKLRAESPVKAEDPLYEPGRTSVEDNKDYEHQDLLPSFPNIHWDVLTEVPYHDKGLEGHPQFRSLLNAATDVFDYNPKIGTELQGVNLANLTETQKNDLARLISAKARSIFWQTTQACHNFGPKKGGA